MFKRSMFLQVLAPTVVAAGVVTGSRRGRSGLHERGVADL